MIQRGAGTLRYRAAHGSVAELPLSTNDTLVIPPNLVHQAGPPAHLSCCAAGCITGTACCPPFKIAAGQAHLPPPLPTPQLVPLPASQFINSQPEGDLQALVVFNSPPIRIHTYANWSAASPVLQQPYFWDRECPPTLPSALQQLVSGAAAEQAPARAREL